MDVAFELDDDDRVPGPESEIKIDQATADLLHDHRGLGFAILWAGDQAFDATGVVLNLDHIAAHCGSPGLGATFGLTSPAAGLVCGTVFCCAAA